MPNDTVFGRLFVYWFNLFVLSPAVLLIYVIDSVLQTKPAHAGKFNYSKFVEYHLFVWRIRFELLMLINVQIYFVNV